MNAPVSTARIERSLRQRLLTAFRRDLPFTPQRILLGFSGGPDSLALAILLAGIERAIPSRVQLIHVDHRIRPESDADAGRCRDLAAALALPFESVLLAEHPVKLHTGVGLEEAARRARYQAFGDMAGEQDVIALAHHAGDQAETVLLHLMHGSGVGGLAGMRAVSDLRVPWWRESETPRAKLHLWRPLLKEHRDDLLTVIAARGLSPVPDESNDDLSLKRNVVRHRALPVLREIEPTIDDRLGALARIASYEDALLTEQAERALAEARLHCGGLSIETLIGLHIAVARRVIRSWLAIELAAVPTFDRVEALFELAKAADQEARVDVGNGVVAGCFGNALRCGSVAELQHRAWLDTRLVLPLMVAPEQITFSGDTITVLGASYREGAPVSRPLSAPGALSVESVRSSTKVTVDAERWNDWLRQQRISPWIRDLVQGIAVGGVMWWIPQQGDYDDAGGDRRVCVAWSDQERGS